MLQLDCPWCGVRDEDEFRYGGEAGAIRPGLDAGDERWSDYLFNRSNVKGVHEERWQHVYGCGRWFSALRDTLTHEVHATYRFGEARPSGDSVS